MKPEVAQRRIAAFRDRFGEAHYNFACHAAFPLALTPDLLYRLWANFQRDVQGKSLEIPWMAVADVLLSSLCEEVGHELYEMPLPMRNALLSKLKANSRFGTARINELSDLLLMYVQQQLESSDPDERDVAQAQRWTALAYVRPATAAYELACILSSLEQDNKSEWMRLSSVIETLAEPLLESNFEPLLIYTCGMRKAIRQDLAGATAQIAKILDENFQVHIAGVNLLVPTEISSFGRRSEPASEPLKNLAPPSASESTLKNRILIVDDTPDNCLLIEAILQDEGYQVEIVGNGEEALVIVERSPPDLILLDILMPGIDGYEVTRRIRANTALPFIPILLTTAYDEPSAAQGLDLGANDLIRKPVHFDELLARVRSLLRLKHMFDNRLNSSKQNNHDY